MAGKTNARLTALALIIIFVSTVAMLLARQFNMGPERPAPDFRTFGPADAVVHIYEYTDFACPACRHAAAALDDMMEIYGDGMKVSFKHYPLLSIHPWSFHAAAYADCAGQQGKFREYAKLLFDGQADWGADPLEFEPVAFRDYAHKLGLDWDKMRACSNDPGTFRILKLDIAEAEMKGVNATPTFFINGKRAVGSGQLLDQAKKFDNLLRRETLP